jgi:hypothetical protein
MMTGFCTRSGVSVVVATAVVGEGGGRGDDKAPTAVVGGAVVGLIGVSGCTQLPNNDAHTTIMDRRIAPL